jgi:uncharacterized phiE125 gp8 family phage protein
MAWSAPVVTVAATAEPITLDDIKAWSRVDSSDNDTRIAGALAAARAYVEAFTGTYLAAQTVQVRCDSFSEFHNIPLAPVTSVVVTYVDSNGSAQTLSSSVYELRSDGLETSLALKYGQAWPSIQNGSRITITAVCGYATVPPPVLQATRALTSAEVDGVRDALDTAFIDALLANFRRFV